jgi:hypothetical protein
LLRILGHAKHTFVAFKELLQVSNCKGIHIPRLAETVDLFRLLAACILSELVFELLGVHANVKRHILVN